MKFKKMIFLFLLKTAIVVLNTITLGVPQLIKKIKDKINKIEISDIED